MKLAYVKGSSSLPDEWVLLPERTYILSRKKGEDHIFVDDDYVSAQHARIKFEKNVWWIEHLGKTNPTTIGMRQLKEGEAAKLHPYDEIKVGKTVVMIDPTHRIRGRYENLVVEVDMLNAVNYSLTHCSIPPLERIGVRNRGEERSRPVTLLLSLSGFAGDVRVPIPPIEPSQTFEPPNVKLHLDATTLEAQRERSAATFSVKVEGNREPFINQQVWILPYNEWSLTEGHEAAVTSFVLRNHPFVEEVVKEIGSSLRNAGPAEALNKLYMYFRDKWNIDYVKPLSGNTKNSQQVRMPDVVLEDWVSRCGSGTCIDLVLLVAACMERIGANPLIIVVPTTEGQFHAMIGCWKIGFKGNELVVREKSLLVHRTVLADVTGFADGGFVTSGKVDFEEAMGSAMRSLEDAVKCYGVDVNKAREEGFSSLPFSGNPRPEPIVKKVHERAFALARDHHNRNCATPHLLLALLEIKDGILLQALRLTISEPRAAHSKLRAFIQSRQAQSQGDPLLSENYKIIQMLAGIRAKNENCAFVREKHIIHSLLQISSVTRDAALAAIDTDARALRRAVHRVLGEDDPGSSGTTPMGSM